MAHLILFVSQSFSACCRFSSGMFRTHKRQSKQQANRSTLKPYDIPIWHLRGTVFTRSTSSSQHPHIIHAASLSCKAPNNTLYLIWLSAAALLISLSLSPGCTCPARNGAILTMPVDTIDHSTGGVWPSL